jgi:hypothetical protein
MMGIRWKQPTSPFQLPLEKACPHKFARPQQGDEAVPDKMTQSFVESLRICDLSYANANQCGFMDVHVNVA